MLPFLTLSKVNLAALVNQFALLDRFEDPVWQHVAQRVPSQVISVILATAALILVKDSKPPARSSSMWLPVGWIAVGVLLGIWSALNNYEVTLGCREASTSGKLLLAILAIVIAPFCEELFYRKMFIDLCPNQLILASLSSVVMFMYVHRRVDLRILVGSIAYILAYLSTGRLWVPITMHTMSNALVLAPLVEM